MPTVGHELAKNAVGTALHDLASLTPAFINGKADRYYSVLSALLALVGAVFILSAFFMWMESQLSLIAAIGFTGLLVLALSGFCFGLHRYFLRQKRYALISLEQKWELILPEMLESAEEEIDILVQENPKTALMLAAVLGFAAAR